MSNYSFRLITKGHVLALLLLMSGISAVAQTPSPTPVNPATQPPGQQVQPATAPPATQRPSSQSPPGSDVAPASQPTPMQEPREPNFPSVQQQPVPPLPDLTRIGVMSSNMLTLSLNDAIRRALQNNNDIEVARDDVRYAEQQLRSLQGFYEPIFSMTPQIIQNITPQQ
ncbi:MAG TPA: hypothetical protein VHD88_05980, partial [Pyrinomonadaceae bacterium]|nr:hypothetical protein [Pyrinomonadaceae bacterium]